MIATVPAHQKLFSYHDVALHHVRRYSKDQFYNLLAKFFPEAKVTWIHCALLVPATIQRVISKFIGKKDSDVEMNNPLINKMLSIWYVIEFVLYKFFNGLPFGLSLIGVAKKK